MPQPITHLTDTVKGMVMALTKPCKLLRVANYPKHKHYP
jgi:hypothetical protein